MKLVHHGVLLKKINYSETSLILQFYTKEKGIQSYIFQGGKKKKGNGLQVLNIVEIEAFLRPESELGKITRVHSNYVFKDIPFNPIKCGLAFFLAELLIKSLKATGCEPKTYDFIEQEIKWLDDATHLTNYPFWFVLRFSSFLGFSPRIIDEQPLFFDLQEGELIRSLPTNQLYIKNDAVKWIKWMLISNKNETLEKQIPKTIRTLLLETLLDYYAFHLEEFKQLKSLNVLKTIFL